MSKSSMMAPSPTNSDLSGTSPRASFGTRSRAFGQSNAPSSTTNAGATEFDMDASPTGGLRGLDPRKSVSTPQNVPGLDFSRLTAP
jgi:hypothetical protein